MKHRSETWDEEQAAEFFGVSAHAVRRMVRLGELRNLADKNELEDPEATLEVRIMTIEDTIRVIEAKLDALLAIAQPRPKADKRRGRGLRRPR
jgi:hypothetical protein